MPRPATGSIRVKELKGGQEAYYGRFSAYGHRYEHRLGASPEMTREGAERALSDILRDIERKTWRPPKVESTQGPDDPNFTDFASLWWSLVENGLSERSKEATLLRLQNHILPYFDELTLSQIDVAQIDAYRIAKEQEGLSASYINSQIRIVGQILDAAIDRDLIQSNPARGKRRLARSPNQGRTGKTYLDYDQLEALLNAAEELEDESPPRYSALGRRALIATLFLAGLRISELCDLIWGDIDFGQGLIQVREAKTASGVRTVLIGEKLLDELTAWKARAVKKGDTDLVFPTARGNKRNRHNVRQRILQPAMSRANQNLSAAGKATLPASLSTHDGRRNFISWSLEAGENPRRVMAAVGHSSAALTLEVYARVGEKPQADPRIEAALARP